MRIAITGSSGLIGTALRASLGRDGHDVLRLVRREDGPAGSSPWDPARGQIDAAALEEVDAVVHLAGAPPGDKRWNEAYRREILESRTKGTDLIATTLASLDRKPAVLISAAGTHYYGHRGDEVLTERSSPGDGFMADVVAAWEAATAPAAEAGMRVATIRTGIVLARHSPAITRLLLPFRLGLGGPLGSGQAWWSWITLIDEVRAIRFLLDHDVAGPVNLTAPSPVTNAQFSKELGRALHRPAIVPVPAFVPKLMVGAELAEEIALSSIRVLPEKLLESGFRFEHPELATGMRAALDDETRPAAA